MQVLDKYHLSADDKVVIFDMKYFGEGVKAKRFTEIHLPEDESVEIAPMGYLINNSVLIALPAEKVS